MLDTRAVLGAEGRIARRLPKYEHRPEQLDMAEAVEQAIADRTHLVVEAGTGVGKSFAYLVPAILRAEQQKGLGKKKRKPIIVSTHTISLQEQLHQRDIPFLNAVLPLEFSAVLVKGRSNYISLRRAKGAIERAGSLFAQPEELEALQTIADWSRTTNDGSLSDLPFRPLPQVWDEVRSEAGNCLGRKCPTHDDCYYYKARRRVWNADILVVNHALFFSDLALRREGANILPDYDVVILDEAHTIESVAGSHLGVSVSTGQIEYHLNKLYNDRTQKGLLVSYGLTDCQQLVRRVRHELSDFAVMLDMWRENNGSSNGRVRTPPKLHTPIANTLNQLAAEIDRHAERIDKDEQRIELTAASDQSLYLASCIDCWMQQKLDDAVYWMEAGGRRKQQLKLICSPIEVADILRNELFNEVDTVILASATLAVGRDNFEFFRNRVGLTNGHEKHLGSPFNYREQVQLYLHPEMPDPAANPADYEQAVCEQIKRHVLETQGRAFVLFTSYKMLQGCSRRLSSWMTSQRFGMYCQGDGLPRSLMLERFRRDERGVLFGTESFWQGVDVPGDALQNVIITKLPFSVPDHPLLEARVEAIRSRGGNPFLEYQVPEAGIKLKQGFGRLIRTRTDTGRVVILDPRILTKPYGRLFLESLPECDVVKVRG